MVDKDDEMNEEMNEEIEAYLDDQWDWPEEYDYEDEEDDDGQTYECQAYIQDGAWYCPIAGTELCDWECKMGGAGWWDEPEESEEGDEDAG